ncbi:hypothetical protein Achl_4096 (plasmid) [Pseudarthrobacter chlorophenolicus A6]|uniref:Uncharacterized protein n=1 Tax=Pseudarthrobacter chlorophenolicus (strain ATCC 700700 / DSM 12829 / CIP 107037 / JCM 12360 / KCTC 9906 / NCIMB 13794 / A6) TaxID=452863 RepID=B8HI00_PSECP|nr:hypothetical protein [Pseudarthrobacter chlorophenolicus]ACL42047.1 hypothetical protein Achl_4096 [Pseudarthrobacter chlorophenolicus A6]SDQ20815.1 hypothetical protein SAMN04489738_0746 [Pseudarthrobacter chlorophenolicus]
MSTKIYNGFRLAEGTDLDAFKSKVRDVIDPLRDQEDIKLLAIETAKYVDSRWLAGDPILPGTAAAAYAQWAEAQSKMSVYDYDHDLNRFELSIGTDPGTGSIMIIARAENHVLLDAFEALPEVEEYGYWDNNDSYPEGVTRADWKIREAAWDRTLPGPRFSDSMDTWVLRDTVEIREEQRSVESFLPHIPDSEDRARSAGLDAYGDYLFRDQGIEVMKAVNHVVFGRGVSVRPVIDTIASYLPALTVELLTEGSHGAVIAEGYRGAVKAACAALYEQDKSELARKD